MNEGQIGNDWFDSSRRELICEWCLWLSCSALTWIPLLQRTIGPFASKGERVVRLHMPSLSFLSCEWKHVWNVYTARNDDHSGTPITTPHFLFIKNTMICLSNTKCTSPNWYEAIEWFGTLQHIYIAVSTVNSILRKEDEVLFSSLLPQILGTWTSSSLLATVRGSAHLMCERPLQSEPCVVQCCFCISLNDALMQETNREDE